MNPFKKETKQLSLFTTAGYPELNSLKKHISLFEKNNIDFVEVGIPFSDPIADGAIIQKTSEKALANGMNIDLIFNQLEEIRTDIPIVLMGYLNPVMTFGLDRFLEKCKHLNIRSVIIPDLSLEIYEKFHKTMFESYQVYPVFIITPKTPNSRIIKIAESCVNSFVYLVSSNATTGANIELRENNKRYAEIKSICTNTPVFIGFGIKTKLDVQRIQQSVDGAIIGSAFLASVTRNEAAKFLEEIQ